ncbi:ciliogenesis-associated TTC17-interacting protein isoform X5 [Canis lupus dingo]|uniref:ciliogenesis-associated TTC17-interacting protein isoform X5 n=1 Tax=Canis lupus dingo TaxID=286419 RepID=UPI0020C587C3|nr:ciliogenesis-associated TTC17-interacting protein isoform X5 [Canis lupus dingo]
MEVDVWPQRFTCSGRFTYVASGNMWSFVTSSSPSAYPQGHRAKDHQPPAQGSLAAPEANAEAIHFLSNLRYLSWKLHIMEQHSQEFIKFHILPMEHKMSLVKQDDQLTMTRNVKEGEEMKTEVTFFPGSSTVGFISQAANLVLLRVMAWRQTVPNNARFLALDTEGKLCYSTYQALGFQTIEVDRQQVRVFIVEQTVHSVKGVPSSCQFYLLSDGHLAKRIQVGSPGYCMIPKMPVLREKEEIEPRPVFGKKPLVWEEDLELSSRFLDRKALMGRHLPAEGPPPPRSSTRDDGGRDSRLKVARPMSSPLS